MVMIILLIIVAAFLIAALPLHMAVGLLGGKSTLLKAFFVNIVAGIVVAGIYAILPFATIIAFITLIWIYREMFRLKWFKAFLAWVVQITLTFLFVLIFTILLGVRLAL